MDSDRVMVRATFCGKSRLSTSAIDGLNAESAPRKPSDARRFCSRRASLAGSHAAVLYFTFKVRGQVVRLIYQ